MNESQATNEKKDRESRLQLAIADDDVDDLHNLIVEERGLLDRVCEDPFPNTPLHLAAAAGKTLVAMEMAILEPSFARKLNPEGYSPMHLALQHEHYRIVRALMALDPELIRIQGRCGITPLHYVAMKEGDNELELLAEFLFACKSSINDLTSQHETAVHVAVKNNNLEAFKVLVGWLKRVHLTEILDWKDQDGNTIYDIPSGGELQHEINRSSWITKEDAKNEALEFFQNIAKLLSPRGRGGANKNVRLTLSLSQLLRTEPTVFEKFSFWLGYQDKSGRDINLLVSTLIVTATYQAALTPSGGFWEATDIAAEKPHQAGNIILSGSKLYRFTALNGLVFLVSIGAILFTAVSLLPRSIAVFLLMWLLGTSYYTTATIEFPKSERFGASLTEGIYLSLQAVVFLVPLILCMSYYNLRHRAEATGRRVSDFLELKDRK